MYNCLKNDCGEKQREKIQILQQDIYWTFRQRIRNNVVDVAAMEKAVWDIFNHRNGKNDNCPDWCSAHKVIWRLQIKINVCQL